MNRFFIVLNIVLDFFWLLIVFYISLFIRENIDFSVLPEFSKISLQNFLFVIVVSILILFYEKIYTIRYDFWQESLKIIKALFLSYVIVVLTLALLKININYSRSFIAIYFFIAIITLPIFKYMIKRVFFYFFKCCQEKILLIGNDKEKKLFQKELTENWYLGQRVVKLDYNKVIIISKGFSNKELDKIIRKYTNMIKDVYVVPYLYNINFSNSSIFEYFNIRRNLIEVNNRLLIKHNILIKNYFDVIIVVLILPLFFIIHCFIFFAIKLEDGGEVFFKQKRLGKDGKVFFIYKYRTMVTKKADIILKEYLDRHPEEIEYYNKYHKYKNDPRITKVGNFLRKTSLDELPQIINVLLGNMSLVGPRPYMLTEKDLLGRHKSIILKVKPGITGLWQVSGRNELTFKQRIELETWYITNWTLWIDFVILIKTIKVVIYKIGAK